MELVLIILVLAVVAIVVSAPLRTDRAEHGEEPEVAALEAERDAKLREIRDAELDFETGKVPAGDHEAIDHALRAEAAEILRKLETAR